ncbi:MAG: hypothetical protein ACRDKI_02935 [Solirubrobacterales bacterium]
MGRVLIRHLDFVVLALALPVFIAADWSLIGYAVAATVWIAQAIAQSWMQHKIDNSDDPRTVVGLTAGGAMARAWFAAIAALIAGVVFGDGTGLAAVGLILVLFTVYFLTKVIGHYYATSGEQLVAAGVIKEKK